MPPSLVVRVAANLESLKKDLQGIEPAVKATSAQMEKLAKSFSGERLITHANNVTAAIREVGVTTLTASQASRNLDLLERAMDKMRRTSEPIPDTMKRTAEQLKFMARSADDAVPAGQKVTQVYRQFDGVLASMGINIGPYVKGIEDVTMAVNGMNTAGAGAISGLGLLATAAGVAAAAFAGWKIGEHIDNTYKLSDAIASGTAVFMGYGDIAEQVALALADANDAELKYEANKRRQAEAVAFYTNKAKEESEALKENWRITIVNANADLQLAQSKEESAAKTKAAAIATRLAATEQYFHTESTDKNTVSVKANTAAIDDRTESVRQTMAVEAERQAQQDAFMKAATLNNREASGFSTDVGPLQGNALQDVVNRYRKAGEKDPNKALERALEQLSAREGTYKVTDNLSFYEQQKDSVLLAQLRQMFDVRGYANGGNDIPGGMAIVGERGPELLRLPGGSDVIPNHKIGSTVLNLTLNVNGAVIGTVRELTEMVSAEMMRTMRGQGFRAPVGA